MDFRHQRLTGTVFRKTVAKGSKSEREAPVLRTPDGRAYILRRSGGNAFSDPEMDKLIGHSIVADGLLADQTFIMKAWSVDEDAER